MPSIHAMTPELHQRAMDLFNRVVELPCRDQAVFLREQCGSDGNLLVEVESLIAWHEGSDLAGGVSDAPRLRHGSFIPAGTHLGPYEVCDVLGVGGTAVVYRARQQHPGRYVALKVIEPDGRRPMLGNRFRREIDLLARLQHPRVAQIYDAGEGRTDRGEVSYLAMELVDGVPINDYATAHQLTVRERIALLRDVCVGVQYAHQCGIIHRDLKPANLLVEHADEGPQAKILDFGISRLIDPPPGSETHLTQIPQIVGTLAYMSPEQIDNDHQIDTSADVYALGVVGYQLLTGTYPIHVDGLPPFAAMQAVKERVPPKLSEYHSSLGGDLSFIFAKALAKDRTERYESAAQFNADLQAFLENKPIQARPPSAAYLARKFVRRNPLLVGGLAAVLAIVAVASIGTIWALFKANQANVAYAEQLDKMTRYNRFWVREAVNTLEPVVGASEARLTMLNRLETEIESLRRYDPEDAELMEDHARVLTQLAGVISTTDEGAEVIDLRIRAAELRDRLARTQTEDLNTARSRATCLVQVGDAYRAMNDWSQTRVYYLRAHEVFIELSARDPQSAAFLDDLAWSHDRIGHLAMNQGDLDGAEQQFHTRLEINQRLLKLAPDSPTTLHGIVASAGLLAELAIKRSNLTLADQYYREKERASADLITLQPHHRLYKEVRMLSLRDLAGVLGRQGFCSEALPFLEESLEIGSAMVTLEPKNLHYCHLFIDVLLDRVELAARMGDHGALEFHSGRVRDMADVDADIRHDKAIRQYRHAQLQERLDKLPGCDAATESLIGSL